jgi:hypothetical protein
MSYISISTGESCTAAQLLAETMVLRRAGKQKIKLTGHFWKVDPWRKYFGEQVIAANALLKIFAPQAIFRALKRKECSWQYSLRTKGLADIIKEEQTKFEAEQANLQKSAERQFDTATTTEIAPSSGKKSLRSKLD